MDGAGITYLNNPCEHWWSFAWINFLPLFSRVVYITLYYSLWQVPSLLLSLQTTAFYELKCHRPPAEKQFYRLARLARQNKKTGCTSVSIEVCLFTHISAWLSLFNNISGENNSIFGKKKLAKLIKLVKQLFFTKLSSFWRKIYNYSFHAQSTKQLKPKWEQTWNQDSLITVLAPDIFFSNCRLIKPIVWDTKTGIIWVTKCILSQKYCKHLSQRQSILSKQFIKWYFFVCMGFARYAWNPILPKASIIGFYVVCL